MVVFNWFNGMDPTRTSIGEANQVPNRSHASCITAKTFVEHFGIPICESHVGRRLRSDHQGSCCDTNILVSYPYSSSHKCKLLCHFTVMF